MIRYSSYAGLVIDTSGGGGGWKWQLWRLGLGSGQWQWQWSWLLLAAAPAPRHPCNRLYSTEGGQYEICFPCLSSGHGDRGGSSKDTEGRRRREEVIGSTSILGYLSVRRTDTASGGIERNSTDRHRWKHHFPRGRLGVPGNVLSTRKNLRNSNLFPRFEEDATANLRQRRSAMHTTQKRHADHEIRRPRSPLLCCRVEATS